MIKQCAHTARRRISHLSARSSAEPRCPQEDGVGRAEGREDREAGLGHRRGERARGGQRGAVGLAALQGAAGRRRGRAGAGAGAGGARPARAPGRARGALPEAGGVRGEAAEGRRGAVAAVLPHWDDDDDRLPGGRLTRALPPRANGHDRGAWCERRNRAASARWAPRLPGQPASGLHPHALVRAAFDHFDRGRRGLWVRHARTHAQSNTHAARGLTVRRSPSGARVATWCHALASRCHWRASWCDALVSPV